MGKKYKNPPIIEAICEFRLPTSLSWDLTIPGLIYEQIQKDFPHREQRQVQELKISQTPDGLQYETKNATRMVFLAEKRNTFVQVGTRLIAVNRLKPYESWEGFRPKIQKALDAGLSQTEDFDNFQQIRLRYINRVEIPQESVELETYFNFRPFLGSELDGNIIESLILGCVFPFRETQDSCKVQLSNTVAESQKSVLLLDIDYFLKKPFTVATSEAMEWVENAHVVVEEVFEDCITDSSRGLFEEVNYND